MGLNYGVAPANTVRKVRARVPSGGGSLTKGNRYVVNTGSKTPLAGDLPPAWHGDVPAMPPQWVLDAAAERTMLGGYSRKRNGICPGCGIMRPNTGRCDNCWD